MERSERCVAFLSAFAIGTVSHTSLNESQVFASPLIQFEQDRPPTANRDQIFLSFARVHSARADNGRQKVTRALSAHSALICYVLRCEDRTVAGFGWQHLGTVVPRFFPETWLVEMWGLCEDVTSSL